MTRVAIIGAGPYGLSIAAHLRALGVPFRIFGTPLDTLAPAHASRDDAEIGWFRVQSERSSRQRNAGRVLRRARIPYHATDIPVSLELFNTYAIGLPAAIRRRPRRQAKSSPSTARATASCSSSMTARCSRPTLLWCDRHQVLRPGSRELAHLPASLATPQFRTHDLSGFAGRDVTVIGGGSSAVDIAALLSEAGAKTSLVARRSALRFSSPPAPGPRSRWERIRHPSSGLGPGCGRGCTRTSRTCSGICREMPG